MPSACRIRPMTKHYRRVYSNNYIHHWLHRIEPSYKVPVESHLHTEAWSRSRRWWMETPSMKGSKTKRSVKKPLIPILNVFKMLGRIPFYREEKDDGLRFEIFSVPMLWAVILNCAQMAFVASIYVWKITHSRNWRNFDVTIISITELVVLNSSYHALLGTWAATPAIVRAVNRWEAYQRRFYAVTGRVVSSTFLDYAYIGLLVILIPSLIILILHLKAGKVQSPFEITKEVVYIVCIYYMQLVFWLFIVVSSVIKKAGESLKESLIETSYIVTTPEIFHLYRTLWLELHECAGDLTSSFGSTLCSWKVQLFTIVVLGSHGFIVSIKDFNLDLVVTLTLAVVDVHTIAYIVYACGYFAQNAVSQNITSALMSRRWTKLSKRSITELELLLDSVEMGSPCFDMGGFFIFNRSTHVAMLELLVTYLFVLLQLKEQSSV